MGFLKILTSLQTWLAETHLADRQTALASGGCSKIMRKNLNTSIIQKRQAKF